MQTINEMCASIISPDAYEHAYALPEHPASATQTNPSLSFDFVSLEIIVSFGVMHLSSSADGGMVYTFCALAKLSQIPMAINSDSDSIKLDN